VIVTQPPVRRKTTNDELAMIVGGVGAPIWVAVLTWSTFAGAMTLLAAGGYLLLAPSGAAPLAAYAFLGLGAVGVTAALVLRTQRDASAVARWRGLAIPGALIALLNILAVMGLLFR
jgi:hypothetical protein